IPERFSFPDLHLDETPADPEYFPWPRTPFPASADGSPRAEYRAITELTRSVEDLLTWTMAWCEKHQQQALVEHPSTSHTTGGAPAVPASITDPDAGAGVPHDRGGAGQGNGTGKRNGRGGRRPLQVSDPVKLQVYERIQREHHPGQQHVDTVGR